MGGLVAMRKDREDDLFDRIGAFLADQGLSPEPAHYSFAHSVLSDPDGAVARAVAVLTRGHVRLSRQDIERFGYVVTPGRPTTRSKARPADDQAATLVAQTRAQVDGFATMMRAMQDETRGFGRDLAQSAAAIQHSQELAAIDEIARITGAMLSRIHDAEARLAQATTEAEGLRAKLAEANDTARRDALTGLPNRRAFDEAFAARDEAGGPYCLAVCDIDRFKRVNDDHGHAVGDRVLTAVGKMLVDEGGGHFVARHGGEEFAILLARIDLAEASALLDDVRASVGAKRFRNRETDRLLGQVTISMGVTAVRAREDTANAFARADRLLYTAKADGRDRVCAA